jgi:hypothetical protein
LRRLTAPGAPALDRWRSFNGDCPTEANGRYFHFISILACEKKCRQNFHHAMEGIKLRPPQTVDVVHYRDGIKKKKTLSWGKVPIGALSRYLSARN